MTPRPSSPATAVLTDAVGRVRDLVVGLAEGATLDALAWRPDPGANPAGWLLWHLTRVQDAHVAQAAGLDEVWSAGGWAERFDLPWDRAATGYGQAPEAVGRFRADGPSLAGYHQATCARTVAFLADVPPGGLDRVVDPGWDPPVTLGVRLVSVVADDLQHVGQAAYVLGMWERR